jgi:hypothetical protein
VTAWGWVAVIVAALILAALVWAIYRHDPTAFPWRRRPHDDPPTDPPDPSA